MSRFKVGDKFRSRKDNQVYEIVAVDAGDWYRLDKIFYLVSEHWLSRDYELVERVEVQESENEKKARELSQGKFIVVREMRERECASEGDWDWEDVKHPVSKQCEEVALAMAEWKDKQFQKGLDYVDNCFDVFQFERKNDFCNKIKELYGSYDEIKSVLEEKGEILSDLKLYHNK